MSDVENAKGQRDLGVMAFRIMQGAIEEGATAAEAVTIVTCWFAGMFAASKKPEAEEG